MTAAEIIAELNRIGDDMMARGDASGRFDPPYTTVHVGIISGGTARNILSKSCSFHWEFRGLPSLDPQEIPARLDRFVQEVALKRLNRFGEFGRIETVLHADVPGLAPDPGSPAEALALRLAGKNHTQTVPFGTEAGHYQRRRHSDRRLRAGLDRSGASAGRIHHARAAGGRQPPSCGVSRPPARQLRSPLAASARAISASTSAGSRS